MVYVNQVMLDKKGVRKNREFLRAIYTSEDLEDVSRWFDFLHAEVSFRRQPDPNMTLDRFVRLMGKDTYIPLQIGSPGPYEIRYCASVDDGVRRHFFLECPYTEWNFDVVSGLYLQAFGVRLEDEPERPGLHHYYEWRKNNYNL
ncbi:MAG: hypothetical protein ABIA62_01830 [Candidatus Woesearchaeota archaeon]